MLSLRVGSTDNTVVYYICTSEHGIVDMYILCMYVLVMYTPSLDQTSIHYSL